MVKKATPKSYAEQLQLAQEVALLRFKTMAPTGGSRVYVPWRLVRQFFDVPQYVMVALIKWLIKKGEMGNLRLTSKLRSQQAGQIVARPPRKKLTQPMLEYLRS